MPGDCEPGARKADQVPHEHLLELCDRPRGVVLAACVQILAPKRSGASYRTHHDLPSQNAFSREPSVTEVWRRLLFFVCVSNVEDHLRNHALALAALSLRLRSRLCPLGLVSEQALSDAARYFLVDQAIMILDRDLAAPYPYSRVCCS